MQRNALFLQGYDYDIEYKSSKSHTNCDGLSRLSYSHDEELPDSDSAEIYNLSQLDSLPVCANDVKRETRRDPTLSKVLDFTTNKWTDAKITEKSGPLSYKVTTGDQGTWRRHADHMVRTSVEPTRPSENTSDVNLDLSAPNISCEFSDNSKQQPAYTQSVRRYPLRNRKPPDRLTY